MQNGKKEGAREESSDKQRDEDSDKDKGLFDKIKEVLS